MFQGLIVYILTLGILFIVWNIVLGYFPFLIVFLFIILFFISLFISFSSMRKSRISIKNESLIIQKNNSILLHFHIDNSSHFQCSQIIVFYHIEDSLKNHLYQMKTYIHNDNETVAIPMKYCGAYHIVVDKIYCYDILRCVFMKHEQDVDCQFYIFPLFNPTFSLLQETTGFHNEANDYSPFIRGEDYSEFFDMRPYRDTDSLKHIHWKASMKKNELYVKEGSQPIIKKILLSLQLGKYQLRNDQSIERFYSLCLSMIQRGIDFEILCPCANSEHPTIELIKSDIYFKECFQHILKNPIQNLDAHLNLLKGYADIYVVNEQGIEVYHYE